MEQRIFFANFFYSAIDRTKKIVYTIPQSIGKKRINELKSRVCGALLAEVIVQLFKKRISVLTQKPCSANSWFMAELRLSHDIDMPRYATGVL